MTHILITVKASERFPHKNALLWPFTRAWLAQELLYLEAPVRVWFVGAAAELPPDLPPGWGSLNIAHPDHRTLLHEACRRLMATDTNPQFVLLQLTQPLRKRHLLTATLDALAQQEPVVSVSYRAGEAWRQIAADGRFVTPSRAAESYPLIDGQIYAWRTLDGLAAVFDKSQPRACVDSGQQWALVDVDYRADLPPNLPALLGSLLTEP